jgi:hypothetical protein
MNWTEVAAMGAMVAALGGWICTFLNGRQRQQDHEETKQLFVNLHVQLNNRMDEWIKAERRDATAIEKQRAESERK